jgi:hypothetical protein
MFRAGNAGEPDLLPDLDRIATHGRRAARSRQGIYAAGTVALAGAVTAGVVSGPSLLGLGSGSSKIVSGSQPTDAPASASKSVPDVVKPSPGVPCATPPTIDWASVVNAALPAGVTATADHSANCVQTPDGTRSVEALFKLSTGEVGLQVTVGAGPEIARKLAAGHGGLGVVVSPGPASGSLDAATLAKLREAKMAAASGVTSVPGVGESSASPSPDPAALASLEAQKRAYASAAATASDSPGVSGTLGIKESGTGSCSQVAPDENACVSHLTKDSLSVVDVQILRTGASPLIVDVTASNGKNLSTAAPTQLPSDATMLAIAQAVAAHF